MSGRYGHFQQIQFAATKDPKCLFYFSMALPCSYEVPGTRYALKDLTGYIPACPFLGLPVSEN
jgi:hypothetical protein